MVVQKFKKDIVVVGFNEPVASDDEFNYYINPNCCNTSKNKRNLMFKGTKQECINYINSRMVK